MKLNYKRTILVGFAFFLIMAFWQAYDTIIPKILTDKFGMNQFWSGIIMALDNIFAVFLLPFFGALSDSHKGKHGKRTPFILIGTIIAAGSFIILSFTDNIQLSYTADISSVPGNTVETSEARTGGFEALYDFDPLISVEDENGKHTEKKLSELYTKGEFLSLSVSDMSDSDLENVTKARQAYAWDATLNNPVTLVFFIVLLLAVLLSMSVFRSPAVALMPDVTPKPLRSKGNAVINLMGSAGGILILVSGIILKTGRPENALKSFSSLFIFTSFIMLIALLVFRLTVKEPQWTKECEDISRKQGIDNSEDDELKLSGAEKLSKVEFISLIFLLLSVALWYMGYNAVSSKYSVYAGEVLGLDYNLTLIVAQGAAIVSFIPVGIISSKLGRKRTILFGVALLTVVLAAASFLRNGSNIWVMNVLFACAGIGWATINVNSYPMVVELASGSDVGKYTGYYYTASMAAQIITPVLSGAFLTYVGMYTLFPYAAIFVALSFVTMMFVKHGDSRSN